MTTTDSVAIEAFEALKVKLSAVTRERDLYELALERIAKLGVREVCNGPGMAFRVLLGEEL